MNAVLRTALKTKKTRAGLHECCASHRIKKKRKKGRKLAQDYINAVLRTALKTFVS
jgi:uncharacterized protein (DUF4415 family)